MATIGHVAAGIAIARAGHPRADLLVLLTIAAAAVAPDLDLLLDVDHRGPTHSIAAVLAAAVGAFIVMRVAGNRRALTVSVLSAAAVASHIVLDLLTAHAPVAILWPFSRTLYTLPVAPLPAAPVGQALLTWDGLLALAAEVVWSVLFLLAAERWRATRSRGTPGTAPPRRGDQARG